jgi:hypothetical protein
MPQGGPMDLLEVLESGGVVHGNVRTMRDRFYP